jgi:hypothetical protein
MKGSIMSKKSNPLSALGISFSWKRALGISQLRSKVSRKIGVPTTREGIERKIGHLVVAFLLNALNNKEEDDSEETVNKNKE